MKGRTWVIWAAVMILVAGMIGSIQCRQDLAACKAVWGDE